jgi:Tripartite tricarboxylate transporter TctA family
MATQRATPVAEPYAWLRGSSMHAASDACLGLILLTAGAVAIPAATNLGVGSGGQLEAGNYPLIIGWLLVAVGIVALLRAVALCKVEHERWSPTSIAVIAAVILAVQLAVRLWGMNVALLFGPAEFGALIALQLALAVALVRSSRIRAIGMVLLGLLIATIGPDVESGAERFTMDLDALADGVMPIMVVLGFVAADGVLAVISPSLLLACYARKVGRRLTAGLRLPVDLILRAASALLVAAAFYAGYWLEGDGWPVEQIAVFAALGLACQIFDWNRLVLLIALNVGALLEEKIRQALVISRGDFGVYWTSPISTTMLALAVAIVMIAIMRSAWVALARRRPASG